MLVFFITFLSFTIIFLENIKKHPSYTHKLKEFVGLIRLNHRI